VTTKGPLTIKTLIVPFLVSVGLAAGFLREIFFAYFLGTSLEMDVLRVAIGVPGILSDGLAMSVVSILIPATLATRNSGRDNVLRHIIWPVFFVATGVFAIGWVSMPLQARIFAPGMPDIVRQDLVLAGRICWIMFLFLLLSLPLRAILSVENKLWPGASAQLVRSFGLMIVAIAIVAAQGRVTMQTLPIAAAVGGLSVLASHLVALGRSGRRALWTAIASGPQSPNLKALVLALLAVFLTQGLLSSGRVIDRAVASNMASGTLAALEYSYALTMAAVAIMGTTANLILGPQIARAVNESGTIPRRIWRSILWLSIFAAIFGLGLSFLAAPAVGVIFQYGAFDAQDVIRTATILRWHGLSLGPLVLGLILTQVLLLTGLQKWVLLTASLKMAIKIAVLWWLLAAGFGVQGVAISLGVTETILAGIMAGLLWRQHYSARKLAVQNALA